ncbi:MAG: DUF6285 domain-containing protein [Reyranellaceae bacterium]
MPAGTPKDDVLLEAAIEYLRTELLPTLEGYHSFQTRVTINALGMILRGMRQGPALDEAETARLAKLLEQEGSRDELNAMLAARIRNGELALDDAALRQHIRRALVEALQVNNPKWLKT